MSPDRLGLVVVGPGRLGRSAAALLARAGRAFRLVGRGEPIPPAAVTWLTVPDREIARVAGAVPAGGIVLHASGATPHDVLRPHRPAGSLHPLMSFPGPEIGLPAPTRAVPAGIAGDPEARRAAHALALDLGFSPFDAPGDRRLYHASAVLAGNFATALLAEAAELLVAAGVPTDQAPALLAPLALTSLENAARSGPAAALTGPVARGDEEVLQAHLAAMAEAGLDAQAETYRALLRAARRLAAQKD